MPEISVIIPAYNAEKRLSIVLDSLLRQTFTDFEVLIVDDKSTDGTAAMAKAYCERDSRFQLLTPEKNGGAGPARNLGLERAAGTFVYFADADDELEPETLAVLREAAKDADLVVGGYFFDSLDMSDRVRASETVLPANEGDYAAQEERTALLSQLDNARCFAYLWNKLYRKSCVGDTRFPAYRISEDFVFNCELWANVRRIRVLQKPVYHYRKYPETSLTRVYRRDGMDFVNLRFRTLLAFYKERDALTHDIERQLCNVHIKHVLYEISRSFRDRDGMDKKTRLALIGSTLQDELTLYAVQNAGAGTIKERISNFVIRTKNRRLIYFFTKLLARASGV